MNGSNSQITQQDRQEAESFLRRQWESGALGPAEHERRLTAARHASTRGELDAALTGQIMAGATGPVIPPVEPYVEPERRPVAEAVLVPAARSGGLINIDRNKANAIVSLMPFLCLVLFFGLDTSWIVFLLIPITPLVLYGTDGRSGRRAERRALKARRQAACREQRGR